MAQGRLQVQRTMLIAQAGLLFFDGGEDDLTQFIRTGSLMKQRLMLTPMMLEAMQRATDKRRKQRGQRQ
jgi:hypothetical protein